MSSVSTQTSPFDSNSPADASASLAASSADLFRSCAAGNCDRAWREFVARFHARLVTAVRRALLRQTYAMELEERVEDLVQEVYCRLLGSADRRRRFQGNSEAQLMAYLQRVALSVVVDARREALAEKRWGGQRIAWAEWRLAPNVGVTEEADAEERLLFGERRRLFLAICREALGRRANSTTMQIARLALLEGWTSREIAAGLDGRLGVAGVDSIISRLRRRLAGLGVALPRRDRLPEN